MDGAWGWGRCCKGWGRGRQGFGGHLTSPHLLRDPPRVKGCVKGQSPLPALLPAGQGEKMLLPRPGPGDECCGLLLLSGFNGLHVRHVDPGLSRSCSGVL